MGTFVSFFLGTPDGLEGHFWKSDPNLYRCWVQYVEEEEPGTFPRALLDRLDRLVAEGPGRLLPTDRADAAILDNIFDTFMGQYCTSGDGLLRYASESMARITRYEQAQPRVESRCSRQVSRCWSNLIHGRAVGRSASPYPYTPRDPIFRLGYWTAGEVRIVHDDLRSNFPELAERTRQRREGRTIGTPDDEIAIKIAVDATARALHQATGLITTVA